MSNANDTEDDMFTGKIPPHLRSAIKGVLKRERDKLEAEYNARYEQLFAQLAADQEKIIATGIEQAHKDVSALPSYFDHIRDNLHKEFGDLSSTNLPINDPRIQEIFANWSKRDIRNLYSLLKYAESIRFVDVANEFISQGVEAAKKSRALSDSVAAERADARDAADNTHATKTQSSSISQSSSSRDRAAKTRTGEGLSATQLFAPASDDAAEAMYSDLHSEADVDAVLARLGYAHEAADAERIAEERDAEESDAAENSPEGESAREAAPGDAEAKSEAVSTATAKKFDASAPGVGGRTGVLSAAHPHALHARHMHTALLRAPAMDSASWLGQRRGGWPSSCGVLRRGHSTWRDGTPMLCGSGMTRTPALLHRLFIQIVKFK